VPRLCTEGTGEPTCTGQKDLENSVIQRGRNILIVVGLLCFAAIATQHLLICPEKYTAEPNTQLHITSDYVCPIDFHPLVFAGFFHPLSFNPRPPPSVG